ncbi:helix-turn-helix transcriptional regulator [Streptomyces sp. SID13666]|uniref:ArsR/SmtB family transcription factor n=1 Tax=unclassified Streptomyces TaxID=2593676 RepID=UPI0013C1AA34|nr:MULTISPECIES: helix-turn-helix domain-containing protein [unclassified Streptomyces]NEA56272.1 helix-turn-helix transcriptional regulator [Streptomyces sp. SID13666]NEA76352.1 helix-turn-helix transcriptional regulator [Streptomyces sp. SID13588]
MPKQRRIKEIGDLGALKALAHPRRQQILDHLALHGPATSATLARALDLNTGATSYHLRELDRHGFVEEAEGTGRGRERWWRAAPADLRFPQRSEQSDEMRPVVDEMNRLAFAADLALFERSQREIEGVWADGQPYSRGSIQVTLPELRDFFEEYIALVNRYKRADDELPEGARNVLTRFLAFPAPADAPEVQSAAGSAADEPTDPLPAEAKTQNLPDEQTEDLAEATNDDTTNGDPS